MIIGLTGNPPAGSGKDTVADYLVKEYGFCKVALADPLKRICADVFGWDAETLWGPSENRNVPDKRYPRVEPSDPGKKVCLTPRHALQQIGDWGRGCYERTWSDYCVRIAKKVLFGQEHKTHDKWDYSQREGLFPWHMGPMEDIHGVVVPDVRYDAEANVLKEEGAKIWTIRRPSAGLKGDAGRHSSEGGISPVLVDFSIENDGSFEWLYEQVDVLMKEQLRG